MVYHVSSGRIGGQLIRNGYLAVDLFFLLSGFVMALTYSRVFEQQPLRITYVDFLLKRIARVYPLYILMTIIMAAIVVSGLGDPALDYPLHVVAANIFMMQAWVVGQSLDSDTWSISTEWAAYLLFPLLVTLLLKAPPGRQLLAAAVCVAAIIFVAIVPAQSLCVELQCTLKRRGPLDVFNGATPWPMLRCLAEFSLGMLVWRVCQTDRLERLATGRNTNLVAALALLLWCTHGTDVPLVLTFAVLIGFLSFGRGFASLILGYSISHLLGEWSYAIYVVHPVVVLSIIPAAAELERFHVPHPWTVSVFLAIMATMMISCAVHYLFEKPARDAARRFLLRSAMA